jgi:hypothetical protein
MRSLGRHPVKSCHAFFVRPGEICLQREGRPPGASSAQVINRLVSDDAREPRAQTRNISDA